MVHSAASRTAQTRTRRRTFGNIAALVFAKPSKIFILQPWHPFFILLIVFAFDPFHGFWWLIDDFGSAGLVFTVRTGTDDDMVRALSGRALAECF